MRRFIVYFSKLFLVNWLVVTFGMVVLVGLLDSLANASAIAQSADQGGALRYVRLRAPIIFDQIFLFALMLLRFKRLTHGALVNIKMAPSLRRIPYG